ncbi:MAG: hypothetical protein RLZZ569_918 [Bacteroidota bacterium]
MKKFTTYLVLVIATVCNSGVSYAQRGGEEVIITTIGNRSVENSQRVASTPKILDTVFPVPNANFPLLAIDYMPSFDLQRIAPATVSLQQKLNQLYPGYAKIGIGSVLMPMADVYYNNTRSRKYNYGGNVQHISSFGPMRDVAPANFDRTAVRGFVSVTEKKYGWDAEALYKNQGLHFYGFPNENANADSIGQRFTTIGTSAQFHSHKKDSGAVNWHAGIAYRHFNDKKPMADSLADWRATENYFAITGSASKHIGNEIFEAAIGLQNNRYNYGVLDSMIGVADSGFVRNNTFFYLRPHVTTYGKNGRLKAQIGVDISISKWDNTKAYLYPDFSAKYSMFKDALIPYVALKGGLTQQSFYALTEVNEFVLSHVELRNENKALEAVIGLKGTISKRIGFNVLASFANVKDRALFVKDTLHSAGNRFNVIYDTMNITTFEAALNYQLHEKIKLDLVGRYYSYNALNNTYAWNLPQVQVVLRGSYNLYDKFIFSADVNLEGGRKALVYATESGATLENGQYAVPLGFIADANLSVEYRYNKRISAFLNFNNIAAQRYKRWYNYPTQGLQAMAGVTFRF